MEREEEVPLWPPKAPKGPNKKSPFRRGWPEGPGDVNPPSPPTAKAPTGVGAVHIAGTLDWGVGMRGVLWVVSALSPSGMTASRPAIPHPVNLRFKKNLKMQRTLNKII